MGRLTQILFEKPQYMQARVAGYGGKGFQGDLFAEMLLHIVHAQAHGAAVCAQALSVR